MSDLSVTHSTFVLEREYPHPPERVFAAWASRDAKAQWFGLSGAEHELDFTVGGRETATGVHEGATYAYSATYHDIREPDRLVYAYEMRMDGKLISVSVASIELVAVDAGTRLTVSETGAYLDGLDRVEMRRAGTRELLAALGRALG